MHQLECPKCKTSDLIEETTMGGLIDLVTGERSNPNFTTCHRCGAKGRSADWVIPEVHVHSTS